MKAPFLNRKSKGFTLIELLVVIAIILTLAGISMIVVNGVMEKSRITTARERLQRIADSHRKLHDGQRPAPRSLDRPGNEQEGPQGRPVLSDHRPGR